MSSTSFLGFFSCKGPECGKRCSNRKAKIQAMPSFIFSLLSGELLRVVQGKKCSVYHSKL